MGKLILSFLVLLIGIVGVAAKPSVGWAEGGTLDGYADWLKRPEVLQYNVFMGPLLLGGAQLSYVPEEAKATGEVPYRLLARVKDNTSLMNLDDSWAAYGQHKAGFLFRSQMYLTELHENDYHAKRQLSFDYPNKTVRYENKLDKSGKSTRTFDWQPGMRDVFSAMYALRAAGLSAANERRTIEVVGNKKPIRVQVSPVVGETMSWHDREINVWKVTMHADEKEVKGKGPWVIWVRDDADLTPIQIQMALPFGSLKAVLVSKK